MMCPYFGKNWVFYVVLRIDVYVTGVSFFKACKF